MSLGWVLVVFGFSRVLVGFELVLGLDWVWIGFGLGLDWVWIGFGLSSGWVLVVFRLGLGWAWVEIE